MPAASPRATLPHVSALVNNCRGQSILLDSDRIPMNDFGQARVRRMPPLFCLLAAGYALAADAGPSASLKQAIQSMQRQDWKQAEQAIDEALEKSPEETAAVYWKSYVLFQTGRYQESSTYAVRYLEKEP